MPYPASAQVVALGAPTDARVITPPARANQGRRNKSYTPAVWR